MVTNVNDQELEQIMAEHEAGVADVLEAYDLAGQSYYPAAAATSAATTTVAASSTAATP